MDPDLMGLEGIAALGQTEYLASDARDVDGARDKLLNLVQSTRYGTAIYYDGWDGLGTVAVLRSILQVLRSKEDLPPELRLRCGRIIYIDCSTWKSKRVMQKIIAKELKLDNETISIFDKQDEDDDFNGVDLASRDAIQDVAAVVNRTLMDNSYILIFIDGSEQEVDLSRLGVPEYHDSILIWTIRRRFPITGSIIWYWQTNRSMLLNKLRNTKLGLGFWNFPLKSSEVHALVREEAGSILTCYPCMPEDDQAMIMYCYLYVLFLHHSFHKGASRLWAAHGANYWLCDGIIQEARTREISQSLYQEVSFDYDDASLVNSRVANVTELMLHPDSPYLALYGDDLSWINANMHPRWISIILKKKIVSDNKIKGLLSRASSIILSFESINSTYGLPNDLLEPCNNLRVLILSYCSFNFSSPLFQHCHTLKFLGLDHCRNNNTRQLLKREDYNTKWAFLHSLWVLDLRYTDWDEILCQANMDVIINMIELNIEGFMCWQYTSKLEGRLPHLQRLRIVKPQRQADASIEIDNSFMGKTKLEVLDLSGNKDIKNLPTSLSKARNLQVLILDGCVGLEKVVLSCSFLRSFSFDGYGPASNWTSMDELPPKASRPLCPSDDSNKKDVKTSLINLAGCTQLKNLFLRGLPNLVELDLSGCQIKILDFETMVMDVPRLQKLFLVGCQHLRAIKWGVSEATENLKLLSIDTRSGDGVVDPGYTRLSIVHTLVRRYTKVCAVTADARLTRSLVSAMVTTWGPYYCRFHIHFTSANIIYDKNTIEEHDVVVASLYNDVSTKVCDSSSTTLQVFPQPPTAQSDHHIEIGDGSCNVENELRRFRGGGPNLQELILRYARSLHVHDTWTDIAIPYLRTYDSACLIELCRVERCPKLDHVFPPRYPPGALEKIWASDLLMARCISSKGRNIWDPEFSSLKHLHLRSCPNLRFALPIWTTSFPMLKTLHIIHCGSLTHVFVLDNEKYNINSRIGFPRLTTIHLHDMPALQQICEVKMMITPKLETIRTRGCWNLRRLPAFGPETGERKKKPLVEMEKDVWDALEWDGVDAGHYPSLFEVRQSRYYKGRRLLRGTVLR